MKNAILVILTLLSISVNITAQDIDSIQLEIDEIERSLVYKKGTVNLESCNVKINVPEGFHFLDKEQSEYVLTELWGNPADESVLGMIFPENRGVFAENTYAFAISFDEMGYVNDTDADNIDYDELLKEMQQETDAENAERIKSGYEPVKFIGWASVPFYDRTLNTLHWAKEIKFGDESTHTLNYNLRVLGRKGVLVLSAIASMNELPEVKSNINKIIRCVEYNDGHKYSDYIPDVDNVAAWTIGSLVAGKVLSKVGFFTILLKFWKVIALSVIAAGSALRYFLTGKKKNEDENQLAKNSEEEA